MKPSVRKRKHNAAIRVLFEVQESMHESESQYEAGASISRLYSTELQSLNETYRTFERLEAAKK